jgi:hypothetical protein
MVGGVGALHVNPAGEGEVVPGGWWWRGGDLVLGSGTDGNVVRRREVRRKVTFSPIVDGNVVRRRDRPEKVTFSSLPGG